MQYSIHGDAVSVEDKTRRHRSYKHYTRLERAIKILESNTLYLGDGSTWSDRYDAARFNRPMDSHKHFGMSFSWLSSENVAMWMLYGGISSTGALIDFPSNFPRFLDETVDEIEFGRFKDGAFEHLETHRRDEGIFIRFVDVAYVVQPVERVRSDTAELRIKGVVHFEMPVEFLCSDTRSQYCIKSAPWFYETETRLIATVPKGLISSDVTTVRLKIPGLSKLVEGRLFVSPRVPEPEEIDARFKRSVLTGELDWDLCAGCAKGESPKER